MFTILIIVARNLYGLILLLWLKESAFCANGGLSLKIPHKKWRSVLRIKTVRRKVANTELFIIGKVYFQGGRAGRF